MARFSDPVTGMDLSLLSQVLLKRKLLKYSLALIA